MYENRKSIKICKISLLDNKKFLKIRSLCMTRNMLIFCQQDFKKSSLIYCHHDLSYSNTLYPFFHTNDDKNIN